MLAHAPICRRFLPCADRGRALYRPHLTGGDRAWAERHSAMVHRLGHKASAPAEVQNRKGTDMALPEFTLRQLLEAGVHFGHQTPRWTPRMKPYIYVSPNCIRIIYLTHTVPMPYSSL